jgi:DNA-binding NarL/FixJ family response regulator
MKRPAREQRWFLVSDRTPLRAGLRWVVEAMVPSVEVQVWTDAAGPLTSLERGGGATVLWLDPLRPRPQGMAALRNLVAYGGGLPCALIVEDETDTATRQQALKAGAFAVWSRSQTVDALLHATQSQVDRLHRESGRPAFPAGAPLAGCEGLGALTLRQADLVEHLAAVDGRVAQLRVREGVDPRDDLAAVCRALRVSTPREAVSRARRLGLQPEGPRGDLTGPEWRPGPFH